MAPKVTLLEGDCHALMKRVTSGSVDLIYTDPPYGITKAPWDTSLKWEVLWPEFWRVLKPNGAVVVHSSIPFTVDLCASNRKDFRYWWVLEKGYATGHLNAKHQPMRNTEEICVFYRKHPTYNPEMRNLDRKYDKTVQFNKASQFYGPGDAHVKRTPHKGNYPQILLTDFQSKRRIPGVDNKTVDLSRYIIRTYSNKGDTVLDPTMGLGRQGVAAVLEGRSFVGFDSDKTHFSTAKSRIAKTQKGMIRKPKRTVASVG